MILFLILVLVLTVGALNLFILPIMPLSRGHKIGKFVKYAYISFVFLLFCIALPVLYGVVGNPTLRDYPLRNRDLFAAETSLKSMARVRRLNAISSRIRMTDSSGKSWENPSVNRGVTDRRPSLFATPLSGASPKISKTGMLWPKRLFRPTTDASRGKPRKRWKTFCATGRMTRRRFISWDWLSYRTGTRRRRWPCGVIWNRFCRRKTPG